MSNHIYTILWQNMGRAVYVSGTIEYIRERLVIESFSDRAAFVSRLADLVHSIGVAASHVRCLVDGTETDLPNDTEYQTALSLAELRGLLSPQLPPAIELYIVKPQIGSVAPEPSSPPSHVEQGCLPASRAVQICEAGYDPNSPNPGCRSAVQWEAGASWTCYLANNKSAKIPLLSEQDAIKWVITGRLGTDHDDPR